METGTSKSRSPQGNDSIIYDEPPRMKFGKNSEADESNLRNFLQNCIKWIWDQKALEGLQSILNNHDRQVSERTMERVVNQV